MTEFVANPQFLMPPFIFINNHRTFCFSFFNSMLASETGGKRRKEKKRKRGT